MPLSITNDAELEAAIERAQELAGCTNDSDEVRELDEIAGAIDAYYWAMQNALRRPAQNDNVPTKH